MQQLMSASPVPSISTELLTTADGELNRELNHFLFDPPSDPTLLAGKRIAICCTNGVEEVEVVGSLPLADRARRDRCASSRRASATHPTLGLRFPPQCATHVLAIRLMENAGWLKIDRYTDEAKATDYDARSCSPAAAGIPTRCAWTRTRALVRAMDESRQADLRHLPRPVGDDQRQDPQRPARDRGVEHQIDVENAGATVLDEPCVVDGNLITARFPYDLPRLIRRWWGS